MSTAISSVADICRTARRAARTLAVADTATKNAALHTLAGALIDRTPEILRANGLDMSDGREGGPATRCSTACAWMRIASHR